MIRERMRAIMPADMLLSENARARGFRLDGYGVFFDVQVPSLEGTLPWVFQTLDQNDLQLDNALRMLKAYVQASAGNNADLQQAFKRIELQVAPAVAGVGDRGRSDRVRPPSIRRPWTPSSRIRTKRIGRPSARRSSTPCSNTRAASASGRPRC